jgi:hypothetical protein
MNESSSYTPGKEEREFSGLREEKSKPDAHIHDKRKSTLQSEKNLNFLDAFAFCVTERLAGQASGILEEHACTFEPFRHCVGLRPIDLLYS